MLVTYTSLADYSWIKTCNVKLGPKKWHACIGINVRVQTISNIVSVPLPQYILPFIFFPLWILMLVLLFSVIWPFVTGIPCWMLCKYYKGKQWKSVLLVSSSTFHYPSPIPFTKCSFLVCVLSLIYFVFLLFDSNPWAATGSMDQKLIIWDLQHSSARSTCEHEVNYFSVIYWSNGWNSCWICES